MDELFLPTQAGPKSVMGTSFVIVGANGSGKSRLGVTLETQAPGKRPGHRIAAQRSLVLGEFIESMPLEKAERKLHWGHEGSNEGTRLAHRWGNNPVGHLLNDYAAMLSALTAEDAVRNARFVEQYRGHSNSGPLIIPASRLDTVRRIWSVILPHRELVVTDGKIEANAIGKRAGRYHGRHMSDGERAVLYMVGQALCAPVNALLIIDEPEIHLHRAIKGLLWDEIEKARPDCLFVYITHDLEFAASRVSATKIWVRAFNGGIDWQWEVCPTGDELPPELLFEVLGSRRAVLFVEGDGQMSLDARVYRALFPERHVIPVGSNAAVDKCVGAFRMAGSLHHTKPVGIVDLDRRGASEVEALAKRGVTCSPYAEIENFLLDNRWLAAVAKHAGKPDPQQIVVEVRDDVLHRLRTERGPQAAQRAEARVAYQLAGFSCKESDPAKVAIELASHVAGIDVLKIYADALAEVDSALQAKDLGLALRIFNQKGVLSIPARVLGMNVDAFTLLALAVLKKEPGLQEELSSLIGLAE